MKTLFSSLSIAAIIFFCINPILYAQNISAGGYHSLAICSDNTARAWGGNTYGQLGDGTGINRSVPGPVSFLTGIIALAGGYEHSLALKNDGTVWTWGNNYYGQLGDGTIDTTGCECKTTPVQVNSLTGIVAIAGGYVHSLALKNDSTVWAWGNNEVGQLGDGTNTDRATPIQVSPLTGILAIACGSGYSLALKNDGTVWAWGSNSSGQLGDGTNISVTTPIQVSSLTGITAITGGEEHSLALKNDGTVWAWGINNSGQLGDGTYLDKWTPLQINSLIGIVAITSGGTNHSLALRNDGTVWAWGKNYWGQLGDGTTIDKTTPIQVSTLTGITGIAAGMEGHSFALKNDGTLWAWGNNGVGQLGDGTLMDRLTPVQVLGLCTPLGVNETIFTNDIVVFSTLSNGIFTIVNSENKPEEVEISVYTQLGQNILSSTKATLPYAVDISIHSEGLYFVQIRQGKVVINKRVIITKK